MWYYVKGKEKIGPVSDATVQSLFESGNITKSTLVWTNGLPQWVSMDTSSIYKKITTVPISSSLLSVRRATYFLRAFLIALASFLILRISYLWEFLEFFKQIWDGKFDVNAQSTSIGLAQLQQIILFSNIFLIFLYFISLIFVMRWSYYSAITSKSLDTNFKYAPVTAAFSFILPIINLIMPAKIFSAELSVARKAMKQESTPLDYAIITTWELFWLLTVFAFLIEKFTIGSGLDNIQVSICFSLYVAIMQVATILLTIFIVSKIYGLQKAFLSDAAHLRGKSVQIDSRPF